MSTPEKPNPARKPKAVTGPPAPSFQTAKSKKLRRTLKSVDEQICKLAASAELTNRQLQSLDRKRTEINRQIDEAEKPHA